MSCPVETDKAGDAIPPKKDAGKDDIKTVILIEAEVHARHGMQTEPVLKGMQDVEVLSAYIENKEGEWKQATLCKNKITGKIYQVKVEVEEFKGEYRTERGPRSEYTLQDAKKDVEFAIKQCGRSNCASTIIDDSITPWRVGMTLTKCGPWKDSEGKERTDPKFNIDWDIVNQFSDAMPQLGSFDFDTIEEGSRLLYRAIHSKVAPILGWKKEEIEICLECGRSVAANSGLFVNRVPDCNDVQTRIDNGNRFPEGDYQCRECDAAEYWCEHCGLPIENGEEFRLKDDSVLCKKCKP